jgi:hypothetical protein
MAGKVKTSIDSEVTGLRAVADAVENSGAGCYKVVLPTPTHEFRLIMVQRLGTCISCSCGVVLSV